MGVSVSFYFVEYGDSEAPEPHSGQGSITTLVDGERMYQRTTIGFVFPVELQEQSDDMDGG